jgi:RimJ/RimL family protein N-acetyltransferase
MNTPTRHRVETSCPSSSLVFEPLNRRDANDAFTLWSDFQTVRLTNWLHTPTQSECEERLAKVLAHYSQEPRHFGPFTIRTSAGLFVGLAGADLFDATDSQYEVWFVIRRDEWGKGLGTRALSALIDVMRTSGRVRHLRATVVTENEASQRLLHNHGFCRRDVVPMGHQMNGLALDLYTYGCEISEAIVARDNARPGSHDGCR